MGEQEPGGEERGEQDKGKEKEKQCRDSIEDEGYLYISNRSSASPLLLLAMIYLDPCSQRSPTGQPRRQAERQGYRTPAWRCKGSKSTSDERRKVNAMQRNTTQRNATHLAALHSVARCRDEYWSVWWESADGWRYNRPEYDA